MLRIAEARQIHNWSQEQLAEAIGTTQQTIQRWETGAVDPKISKVEAISSALGVTMSFLLGLDSIEYDSSQPTTDERRLIDLYRSCSPKGREYLLQVAEVTASLFGGE